METQSAISDQKSGGPNVLKIIGSVITIGMMGYVIARDDNNEFKEWNTVIVVAQSLILLLLWMTDKFPCGYRLGFSYVVWAWALAFGTLMTGVLARFRKDKNKYVIYAVFFVVNLLLMGFSLVTMRDETCPWRKPKTDTIASPRKTQDDIDRILAEKREALKEEFEEVGRIIKSGSPTTDQIKKMNQLRDELKELGVKQVELDAYLA